MYALRREVSPRLGMSFAVFMPKRHSSDPPNGGTGRTSSFIGNVTVTDSNTKYKKDVCRSLRSN